MSLGQTSLRAIIITVGVDDVAVACPGAVALLVFADHRSLAFVLLVAQTVAAGLFTPLASLSVEAVDASALACPIPGVALLDPSLTRLRAIGAADGDVLRTLGAERLPELTVVFFRLRPRRLIDGGYWGFGPSPPELKAPPSPSSRGFADPPPPPDSGAPAAPPDPPESLG